MNITDDTAENAPGLRTLERGLDVLDLFCHGATRLSLTEIAGKIDLTPSTTSRLLRTLQNRGYLSRDEETKKFVIGPQALRLTTSSFRTFDLRRIAAPILQKLHEQYNESLSLYVVLDGHRVCVDRLETTHALRHVVNIGERMPLTRGASGKVLLAWMPAADRKAILAADASVSTAELDSIKKNGYAISMGERDQGVGAVAAPIFDAAGNLQCALALAGPFARLSREDFERMAPDIVNAANQISLALGHIGPQP